jgi:phosphatidylinositol alpha-mannosyltransferase
MAAVGGIAAWRAPQIADVLGSLADVRWWWAAAAIGANLASLALRGLAWIPVLGEAVPGRPGWRHGLSAYTIGQFGNALLPGRLGEVAKMAVVCRRTSGARATWAAVGGSILAHRLLDAVPLSGLALFVLLSSGIPGWAVSGVLAAVLIGMAALGAAAIVARRGHAGPVEGGRLPVALAMARRGLGVLRAPVPALWAVVLLSAGWTAEVAGAWLALRAFGIDAPGEAAGLVVLVTNALMAFPFWPGNVGLLQAGVALALVPWGVASATGVAYGIGLQAIEILTALGPGLVFLAAEGLSFAALRSLSESGLRELEAGPPDEST